MALLCCTATVFLMHQTLRPSADACFEQARPDTTFTGLDRAGRCTGCTHTTQALVACSSDDPHALVADTVREITVRTGCWDNWCLACTAGAVTPPVGAHIYVSADCKTHGGPRDAQDGLPRFSIAGPVENVTLHIPNDGAVLENGPLVAVGGLAIVGGPLWIETPSEYVQCGVHLRNRGAHDPAIYLAIESVLYIANNAECAVSISPVQGAATVSGSVGLTYRPSGVGLYFDYVVDNTQGRLRVPASSSEWHGGLLVLDVAAGVHFVTDPPLQNVTNLSSLLSTFGTAYEVEVHHEGAQTTGGDDVTTWNQILLVTAILLALTLTNH